MGNVLTLLKKHIMITIQISDTYRERFDKLLNLYHGNHDDLIQAMLEFKVNDLKKGIQNIKTDLTYFENKYQKDTVTFYREFAKGNHTDENDDFLIWSGEYETYREFEKELLEIS